MPELPEQWQPRDQADQLNVEFRHTCIQRNMITSRDLGQRDSNLQNA